MESMSFDHAKKLTAALVGFMSFWFICDRVVIRVCCV